MPADIELLFHFCYGDSNHKHVVEPTDMADMVELANRLSAGIKRPIELIHMPVPRGRADDAYFAPLKALKPQAGLASFASVSFITRRRRGHATAACGGGKVRNGFLDRDRMRIRSPRPGDDPGAVAHPR